MKTKILDRRILTYIGLVGFLGAFLYVAVINSGGINDAELLVFALMWIPAVAAIITKLAYDKNLKGLGLRPRSPKCLALSYFLPVLACIPVYFIVWAFRLGQYKPMSIPSIISLSTVGVIISCISAMGEEIGWRGFLLNELIKKFSYLKTSLIMAAIWYLYHLPLIVFSDYNNGNKIYSMCFFFITITGYTFIVNYLVLKSKSVWPGIIIHASHNLFVQAIFDQMTVDTGFTKYFTTEFGCGLTITYWVIALILIFYEKKHPIKNIESASSITTV